MITLHHCPQTRSMRTLWLLHELDIPFRLVVHPFDKSLRRPEFLSLSPAGRVPALEIDGERTLAASCIRTPADGMVVKTATERATSARKSIIEMLLADQPERESAHDRSSHR